VGVDPATGTAVPDNAHATGGSAPGPDGETPAVPFDGVDADEWNDLIAQARTVGTVHAEEVTHVLRHIELTGDVLTQVQTAMQTYGISIDDDVDHVPDDTPASGARRVPTESGADVDDDERLLRRGRSRRTRPTGPTGDNSTSDAVRMYLREIGQVELLTVEHERRLAQLIEEGKLAATRIDEIAEKAASAATPGTAESTSTSESDSAEERMLMRAVSRGASEERAHPGQPSPRGEHRQALLGPRACSCST
jgi:RNA polymerase primary sigma factor